MPAAPSNERNAYNHPVDRLPGYRTLRPLRTRGLPRELLAIREGTANFRRLCSLRFAPVEDHAGEALAREAYILARVHHPMVLPAFDLLEVDGWRILVLAFEGVFTVDRISAALRKRPVRLDTQAALFVAHRLFDALAHAHGKNDPEDAPLVHGDIHPANIVVRRDGHVLIRGFRGADPVGPAARANPVLALGPYAAPELDAGRPATIYSDVYGAAAVVWELFVGQALPTEAGVHVPSLAVARPDLPAELAAVFDVCLSPDPDARRIRAATVAATLRKAVDLHGGRESLERLYVRVMKRLPASIRALCAGTLPPHDPKELSSPTQRFVRGEDQRSPGVLLVGHPTHPLHRSLSRKGDADDAVREAVPAALAFDSTDATGSLVEIRGETFDDEAPTLRKRSPIGEVQKCGEWDGDDDDTIVNFRAPEHGRDEEMWGKIEPSERGDHIDSPRGRFATTMPTISGGARRDPSVLEPRSFPPVASDPDGGESHEAERAEGPRLGYAIGIALLLAPLAWLAGQYGVGPLWTSWSNPSSSIAPTALANAQATPVERSSSDRIVPPKPKASAPKAVAQPTSNGVAPPKPVASALEDPSQPVIPFHQSMVMVEGPPDGVVYVNGYAVGRTGERSLTRGCGLRFVRVGTEAKGATLHGVRWLSKGQTAKLPCGTLVNLRAVPKR